MIVVSPHNDDEALFVAYTIMRHKPKVVIVTDSYVQGDRGTGITKEMRRQESVDALSLVGVEPIFLGLRDDDMTPETLKTALRRFEDTELVYCPALQGGHPQHDMVYHACKELFTKVKYYTTYTKDKLRTTGDIEVIPMAEEMDLKNKMLNCYKSQIEYARTKPYFDAVRDESEWIKME
jgi:LmbE family N-acetylglucosaminyl deacetylase